MKQMSQKASIKKLIATVLAIIMVVGILPSGSAKASTEATEQTVYGLKDISGQTEVVHELVKNQCSSVGTLTKTENVEIDMLVTSTQDETIAFGFGQQKAGQYATDQGYQIAVVKVKDILNKIRIVKWENGGNENVAEYTLTTNIPDNFRLRIGVQTMDDGNGTKYRKVYVKMNDVELTYDDSSDRPMGKHISMATTGNGTMVTLNNLAKEVSQTEILSTETNHNMPMKTIETTLVLEELGSNQCILAFEVNNTEHFLLSINKYGYPYIFHKNADGSAYKEAAYNTAWENNRVIPTGVPIHVAFVLEGDVLNYYLDGTHVGGKTIGIGSQICTDGRLVIGGDLSSLKPTNERYVRGIIQDVKLYSDARTADEIKADMTTLDTEDLITYYDFGAVDEKSYTVQDLSGNGKHLSKSTSPFALSSVQATLTDSLAMNYTLGWKNSATAALQSAKFEMNGEEIEATVTNSGTNSTITFAGIRAQNMADTITAIFNDGNKYAVYSYSMMDYMKALLDDATTDATLKHLIVDMVQYGAKVQAYRGETDTLTAYLTDTYLGYDTTDASLDNLQGIVADEDKLTGTSQEGDPTWKGVSLNLRDKVNIRCRLEATSVENLSVRVYKGDTLVETVPSSSFIAAGNNTYYLDFDEIYANEYASTFTFKFYNGEKVVGQTLNYSVNTYLNAKKNVAEYTELLQAIHAYGSAAESVTQ